MATKKKRMITGLMEGLEQAAAYAEGKPDRVRVTHCVEQRPTFTWFRSETCHRLKRQGDLAFIRELLETDEIRALYDRQWYFECLYLLAMLDYVSRENDLPLCSQYGDLRRAKLAELVYPMDVELAADLAHDDALKETSVRNAIPEFLRHNIVEGNVRDVI